VLEWATITWRSAQLVEVFTRLEAHGAAGSNADLGPGTGIASDARFTRPDIEHSKAPKLDAVAPGQGAFQAIEDGFDGGLGFYAGQSGTLNYLMYDVLLNQWLPPETATRNAAPSVLRRC